MALAGKEQSQPVAVPLGLYSPAPGSPQHTRVTLALWVPTPDTKIARLRASPFLEGQQQLEPREGGGSGSWDACLTRTWAGRDVLFRERGFKCARVQRGPKQRHSTGEKINQAPVPLSGVGPDLVIYLKHIPYFEINIFMFLFICIFLKRFFYF